ncbi:hypothetical protein DFP74_4927 [Nocardiopsis sp. Huas11]|uniref:VOC family protein n=1 Tax=Nocardiopsis sp. Huas11 TaxID=2183912 RepID=UPI000EAE18F9|nr:VOC family protein [Nocardiopsis sp. Huas11]RKS09196.1 hypothetical protein DFP74_4927 [Nocardiopsis sp. Huas11]
MPPLTQLTAITLDCPDPQALAAFYRRATGWRPHERSNEEFAALVREDGLVLGFQRVEDHRPPRWPDPSAPQQSHFDFTAGDLDEAEALLLEWGAGRPDAQPGGDRWRVFTDPAGHPFCVIAD